MLPSSPLHSLMLHTGMDIMVLIMTDVGMVPGIIKETGITPMLLWLTLMDMLMPQHISQLLPPLIR
jgi:hypothetical protein